MYRTFARKGWDVVGWTFHADIYCKVCGDTLPPVDPEGNERHPIFVVDETQYVDAETNSWVPYVCGACGLSATEW